MTTTTRASKSHLLDASDPGAAEAAYFNAPFGLFGRRKIKAMAGRKLIRSGPAFDDGQFQPASLDLRLGKEAYRVRASFLPGRGRSVKEHLESFDAERIALTGEGAVLEKGIVYIARLTESLALLPSISGAANPKSSTGRLDIFTRLIVDGAEAFDEVPLGYHGELWLEVSPRSFSVRVHEGSRLSQIRFRSRNSQQMGVHNFTLSDDKLRERHAASPLVDGELTAREGVLLRVDLGGAGDDIVGYRAIKNSSVIDVNRAGGYAAEDFWEPIRARADRRLILDPGRILYPRLAREGADPRRPRRRNGADRSGDRRVPRPLRRLLRSRLRPGSRRRPVRARGAGSAQPRRAVPARGRPAGRPSGLRGARRRAGARGTLRRRPDLQLPGPGPQARQAFPRLQSAVTAASPARLVGRAFAAL